MRQKGPNQGMIRLVAGLLGMLALLVSCGHPVANGPVKSLSESSKAPPPTKSTRTGPTTSPAVTAVTTGAAFTPHVGFQPQSVAFWNSRQGILAGLNCDARGACAGEIRTTADGGRTWRDRFQVGFGLNFTSADVVGSTYGWVAVSLNECQSPNQADCRRVLERTADGGRTWQTVNFTDQFGDPSFVTPSLGWAAASSGFTSKLAPAGTLLTTNGGRTWHSRPGPADCQGRGWYLRALSFPTAAQGYALCDGQATGGSQDKAVFTTADGGKTWTRRAHALSLGGEGGDSGISINGYPAGIFFLPDGHGWIWQSRGNLLASTDGGATWWESHLTDPGNNVEARSVWFLSDQSGFVLLAGFSQAKSQPTYRLVATRDGGRIWTTVHTWP